jgi:hypothetical protein
MKKLDKIIHEFDERVEHAIQPVWKRVNSYFALFSSTLLLALFSLFLLKIFNAKPSVVTGIIRDDLALLERVLHTIDASCNILAVRQEKAQIDFLTVAKFSGSSIGCLNLAHPKRWQGPYLKVNPLLQERPYEIVRTKEGYFILPGAGVLLPNNLEIGKDIIVTHDSALTLMMQPGGRLNYQGQPLAIALSFKVGDWDAARTEKNTVDKINDMLKEFNEAMPFAQRGELLGATISC